MGNLGWSEMFFIVVFALIIFGPRKLPEIAKTLGRTLSQLRRASDEFKHAWESEVDRDIERKQIKRAEIATAKKIDETDQTESSATTSTEASLIEIEEKREESAEPALETVGSASFLIKKPEASQPSTLLNKTELSADSSSVN
ncbi:MAG: twin-arginine translocase TatA/TatE family subunit [Blastocatellia bacterium]|nr:twin-arginine translocase TatA/TatE family subunit [Blastocatellia bacterium]